MRKVPDFGILNQFPRLILLSPPRVILSQGSLCPRSTAGRPLVSGSRCLRRPRWRRAHDDW